MTIDDVARRKAIRQKIIALSKQPYCPFPSNIIQEHYFELTKISNQGLPEGVCVPEQEVFNSLKQRYKRMYGEEND